MTDTPVTIVSKGPSDALARHLGEGSAALLGHLIAVADREDRLEAGSGEWKQRLGDAETRQAARLSVLRALATSCIPSNFEVLEAVVGGATTPDALVAATALERLALSERIGDLVSCGMLVKLPERGAILASASGTEVVRVVHEATDVAASALRSRP